MITFSAKLQVILTKNIVLKTNTQAKRQEITSLLIRMNLYKIKENKIKELFKQKIY